MKKLTIGILGALTLFIAGSEKVNATVHDNYRQTYYTYVDGDFSVGARTPDGELITLGTPGLAVIDNEMKWYDRDYGWVSVFAINLDEVKATQNGYDFDVYGSIIEITYPNGNSEHGIILDACGACRYADKIDKWLYEKDKTKDIKGVSFIYKRYGWSDTVEEDKLITEEETESTEEATADNHNWSIELLEVVGEVALHPLIELK